MAKPKSKSRISMVPRKGRLIFAGKDTGKFVEENEPPTDNITAAQEKAVKRLNEVVAAYLKAAEELLQGKYNHLRDQTPKYLSDPGNIVIFLCHDGVVIRYETSDAKQSRIFSGVTKEGIATTAREVSQNLVNCCAEGSSIAGLNPSGVELKLFVCDQAGKVTRELVAGHISFNAVISKPKQEPTPPQRPYRLLSVLNSIEFGIVGELAEEGPGRGQRFITRSTLRLPVGWECLEVFPYFKLSHWKPEYASVWAENDILSWVVAHQARDAHYNSLDVRAAVRRQCALLLAEFKSLLDSNPEREQSLQDFLQSNPQFLCPAHTTMWPKLPFGAKVTDFVFRTASNEYLLVEIEKSTHELFRRDGHPTAELTTAQGQITDWKRYIADNLSTVQRELGLKDISSNPEGLVVIGRSTKLSEESRRKLRAMASETPKLRVATYDDIYENAKAVFENILGPMWDIGGQTQIYYPN